MSQVWIPDALREAVRRRSATFCEYCGIPEAGTFFAHQVDHVIAEQHGGETTIENLALAFAQCNRFKGPNIASIDPDTKRLVPLFNPRIDKWSDHFRQEGGRIIPLTPIGRATSRLLNFGHSDREEARHNLGQAGRLRA
jgi:5-methylcytosine-specific restriction endonuclease McrA